MVCLIFSACGELLLLLSVMNLGSGDASLQTMWRYYTDFDERATHTQIHTHTNFSRTCVNEKSKLYYATLVPTRHLWRKCASTQACLIKTFSYEVCKCVVIDLADTYIQKWLTMYSSIGYTSFYTMCTYSILNQESSGWYKVIIFRFRGKFRVPIVSNST